MKKVLFLILAVCLTLTGCGKVTIPRAQLPEGRPAEITAEKNELKAVSSYSEVFSRMSAYYEKRNVSLQYGNGMAYDLAVEEKAETPAAAAPTEAAAPADANTATGMGDGYSETNVQVEGIDEADIVKTDGKYIYCLFGNTLKIYEANGPTADKVCEKEICFDDGESGRYFSNMYLNGNSLVFIGSRYDYNENKDYAIAAIYDVSDRRAPKKAEEFGQSGYVSSTRMVGDILYVISTYGVWQGNAVEDEPSTYCPVLYRGGVGGVVPVDAICIPDDVNYTSWLTVASYSIADREMISVRTMLGSAGNVYMSGDHIYVAEHVWEDEDSEPYTLDQYTVVDHNEYSKTNIYKFAYSSEGKVEYLTSGAVVGGLLDQFSMDEYEGNLRVVTTRNVSSYRLYTDEKYGFTNYDYDNSSMDNGLYVFDGDMKIIGSVEHLGEDERVYSTRFSGPVGYFVTFRETDPLFAVDLSDPANPTVLSALKINGFSQYLHNWGDGLLLGLGMEADDTGVIESMKLSMFDVSDPKNVTEKDKTVLPYWYSNGLYDHHAVFVDVERGLVGFGFEGNDSQGYVLYKYSGGGFEKFAEIIGDYYSYNSRGVRIGNYFYVLTENNVTVIDLATGVAVG